MDFLIGVKNVASEYSQDAKYVWIHVRSLGLAPEYEHAPSGESCRFPARIKKYKNDNGIATILRMLTPLTAMSASKHRK